MSCFKKNDKIKPFQNEIIEAKFINDNNDISNKSLLNIINEERNRLNKLRLQLDELRIKDVSDKQSDKQSNKQPDTISETLSNKVFCSIKLEINDINSNIENLCKIYYK